MPIDIALNDADQRQYRQDDAVRATAAWELDRVPKRIEVRLYYTTQGKGTTDTVVVASEKNESPQAGGRWDVSLTIPADAPSTYDGRLLSIRWGVEAVTDKSKEFADATFTVSPTGQTLRPQSLAK
ncbi:MAG: hypothetical protein QM754_02990 [Tepidisphaeraceae bacterium]